MPRRQWRLTGLAAGGVECVTGVLVCSGAYPMLGGAGLAALGAVFCVLLAYVLIRQVPGGCGCIRWRAAPETAAEAVTWRAVARSGVLLGAGIAYMLVSADAANAPRRDWSGAGVVASGTVLVLLSMHMPVRTPVCRRPLWRRTRTTLRVLASHEMFAAMAASAGPFGPVARYRRTGCTDEFWFTAVTGQDSQAVVFQVHQAGPGVRLAVHASLREARTLGTSWPTRAITVADVLTASGNGGRRNEVSGGQLSEGTIGGLSCAHPSRGSWPHGHRQRSGRGGMRAGYDGVRQPELAGTSIICNIVCSIARRYDDVARFAVSCQHRCLCHRSAENQHHRHRRSGGPGRRLPQIHQRQPRPVPHERLACCDRADGRGKDHAPAARAIDHVRRLALYCPATRGNTAARRFRLRGCRGGRPASRRRHSLPRTVRAPPGEPARRSGKCDHLGVVARRGLLPAGLHISRRLADGWDVDDNNAFQHSALGAGRGLDQPRSPDLSQVACAQPAGEDS